MGVSANYACNRRTGPAERRVGAIETFSRWLEDQELIAIDPRMTQIAATGLHTDSLDQRRRFERACFELDSDQAGQDCADRLAIATWTTGRAVGLPLGVKHVAKLAPIPGG